LKDPGALNRSLHELALSARMKGPGPRYLQSSGVEERGARARARKRGKVSECIFREEKKLEASCLRFLLPPVKD
jgi:hypothetical protein